MTSKEKWLAAAEVVDAWRVVPRIIMFGYCVWTIDVVWKLLAWYMALPGPERSLEASGFAAGVITAVTGLNTFAIRVYVYSGRKWNGTHVDQLDK